MREFARQVRESFDERWSREYRLGDDQGVGTDQAFEHYGGVVTKLSSSFGRPIDALDAGCGTGRYFHRLRNVNRLVGADLSQYMLDRARTPVRGADVQVGSIELLCGDVASLPLASASFDLIYSVGVFAEYSPLDVALLLLFERLLKPSGVLFVTAVDIHSRVMVPEHAGPSLARRVFRRALPVLPPGIRLAFNRTLSPFYLTRDEVEARFAASQFTDVEITSYAHVSGWMGTHFDCLAFKKDAEGVATAKPRPTLKN